MAMTDGEGNQTPILIFDDTNEEDEMKSFYSLDCTAEFILWGG